jgi:hypothetical protein
MARSRCARSEPPTPWTERDIRWRIVHDDLHRHALDDLDVIAGGILRRQQRERGAGSGLNAVDMATDFAFRKGIDLERHRLSGPHAVELNLLEVRRNPDLIGHKRGQVRAGLCELPDCSAEINDAARLRRRNRRIGQIELRLVALCLGLGEARGGAVALRLKCLDLALREAEPVCSSFS